MKRKSTGTAAVFGVIAVCLVSCGIGFAATAFLLVRTARMVSERELGRLATAYGEPAVAGRGVTSYVSGVVQPMLRNGMSESEVEALVVGYDSRSVFVLPDPGCLWRADERTARIVVYRFTSGIDMLIGEFMYVDLACEFDEGGCLIGTGIEEF